MSLIEYDKENIKIQILYRLATALDVDILSNSSNVKLISDIISEEISNVNEIINQAYNDLYLETASDSALEKITSNLNIFRKKNNVLNVNKNDNIIKLKVKDNNKTFNDAPTNEEILFLAGETFVIKNSIYLTLTENIFKNSALKEIYISCQLKPLNEENITINKGEIFSLISLDNFDTELKNFFIFEIDNSINIDNITESDNQLRQRAIFKKNGFNNNLEISISNVLSLINFIDGSIALFNQRGTGTLDIGFTTKKLQKDGSDDAINSIYYYILSRINEIMVTGTDLILFIPEQVNMYITYLAIKLDSNYDEHIKDIIYMTFIESYKYSIENELDIKEFENKINNKIKSIFNNSLIIIDNIEIRINNEILDSSNDKIKLPISYYLFLNKNNIERKEDT